MPDHSRHAPVQRPSYTSSLVGWLRRKNYQYEVTFSLYMLTPTEKAIFNLILFVLVSLLVTAASLYLPNHIGVIYNRIWYYLHGELATKSAAVGPGGADTAIAVGDKILSVAQRLSNASQALKTASHTMPTVAETVASALKEL